MKSLVGVALVTLAALSVPAMAQTAPAAPAKKTVTRMACKNEAITGSFTRKARQCRHAVTTTAAAKPKAQEATRAQPAPAPAAEATAPSPTSTEAGNEGL